MPKTATHLTMLLRDASSDSACQTVIGEQKHLVNSISSTNQCLLMDAAGAPWTLQRGFLCSLGKICIDTSMYDGINLKSQSPVANHSSAFDSVHFFTAGCSQQIVDVIPHPAH